MKIINIFMKNILGGHDLSGDYFMITPVDAIHSRGEIKCQFIVLMLI